MTLVLILLIPCILGVAVLYCLKKQKRGLQEVLHLSWNYFLCNKIFIILLACFYLFFYVAVRLLTLPAGSSAEIYLNYDGASNGLNPNETRYNPSEIISDEVLELAIREGNLEGFTVDSLRRCLELEPVDNSTAVITLPDDDTTDISSNYSIQTGYRIKYDASKADSKIDAQTVADVVAGAYSDYFTNTYLDKYPLLEISEEELGEVDTLDYLDALNYFETKSTELQRYMIEYQSENGSYQSPTTGETFYSLHDKINHFIEIGLERFEAYLLDNGVSKDSDQYINKLDYENKMSEIDYQKDWAVYETNLDAVDIYHREMARVVLVPTEDDEEEFYMSRTRIGVDYLSETAEDSLQSATNTMQEINTNEYAIEQLENESPTEAVFAKAEEMCTQIKDEIASYAKQCDELISEYLAEKESGYLVINTFKTGIFERLNLKQMIVCTVIVVFLADMLAMFRCLDGKKQDSE